MGNRRLHKCPRMRGCADYRNLETVERHTKFKVSGRMWEGVRMVELMMTLRLCWASPPRCTLPQACSGVDPSLIPWGRDKRGREPLQVSIVKPSWLVRFNVSCLCMKPLHGIVWKRGEASLLQLTKWTCIGVGAAPEEVFRSCMLPILTYITSLLLNREQSSSLDPSVRQQDTRWEKRS